MKKLKGTEKQITYAKDLISKREKEIKNYVFGKCMTEDRKAVIKKRQQDELNKLNSLELASDIIRHFRQF
jgi:hypothetical protein